LPECSPKIVAEKKYELVCANCDLRVAGHLENATFDSETQTYTGGHFVADEPRRA
jgi:hypothetical protein